MSEEISIEELPDFPREFLGFRGFKTLNPPQHDALKYLTADIPRNLIVAIPTGSGKTLIGEMGMARAILYEKKKAVYLTPLIALANEKFQDFKPYEEQYRVKVAVRTGEYQSSERDLSKYDVIISTYEKWVLFRCRVKAQAISFRVKQPSTSQFFLEEKASVRS